MSAHPKVDPTAPEAAGGVHVTASLLQTWLLQRGGQAPLRLLHQRFPLDRFPGGPAFGALLLQGRVEVTGGTVRVRRSRQPDDPEPPVWGRVSLAEEAVRGDLPLVGSLTLSREEVLQAQVGGLGLELGASPIRVALWPNVGSMSLRVRLTQEEP